MVDPNIVIIGVSIFKHQEMRQLWIEFCSGKSKQWLRFHEYAVSLSRRFVQDFDSGMHLQVVVPYHHLLVVERRWHRQLVRPI